MDEDGEILKDEKFENSLAGVQEFFKRFKPADVVMESSYSWRPTYERLEEIGLEAKLAHPKRTRAIAESEIKTDSIDARTLAHLLRVGLVHESYVPSEEVRQLRDQARLRTKLVRERTKFKNKIWAELEKNRVNMEKNPFTKKGKEKLRELNISSVDHYLAVLETIDERIKMVSKELEGIAEDREDARLLMTIPGISHFSALLILSEIGDIDRFPDPEKLCSYAGLVPKVHKSGDTVRIGEIKKEGDKLLRWIMIECVWFHVNHGNSHLTKYYERKKREKDSKRAAIATANKLLTVIYWMLKRKEEFRPNG
ncbi:hypothetical protein AKJ61_03435 [candidate division MSBL1 archaeon SCGC-AAA259B11]|uniref:Uncharacterized protein n=1 Tax=candidate division MSBL1 archaeon SCGC-AAA259B11 TaxID=1698260 RepID=A0A133U4P4_9EURY|nr:hypothetical protein AKJ61_03435 [candidate division MSBL1 archaeon SCGC-AAA259B11]